MFIHGNLSFSKTASEREMLCRASLKADRSVAWRASNSILHGEIAFDLSIRPEGGEEATLASIYTSDREKADDI